MDLDDVIAGFDVDSAAFIANPYPALSALREAAPIVWNERSGQWLVTRFAEVSETLRDRRLGRNYTHMYTHAEVGRPEPDPRWADFYQHELWSLLSLEPPDHTRLRRLVSKVFTPRAVAALRPMIEQTGAELLDRCAERGRFDLLADYAQPYSVAVITSMLGVPRADTQLLLDWSHAIVKMYELSTSDDQRVAANRAAGEYIAYTRALIAEKRKKSDGKLIAELVAVEDEGDTLTEDEIVSTAMVLLEAGHEATVNTLGNGMRALMHHPDQWARLTSGEVDARTAVEELLRWDPSSQLFNRWVLQPGVEIAGQPLKVGEDVAMLFGSAQHDPRRFDHPDTFDIGRGDAAHVGFGAGMHFCIGAPLARLELEISLAAIVDRFPRLTLAAEPEYQHTFVLRGLKSLDLSAG